MRCAVWSFGFLGLMALAIAAKTVYGQEGPIPVVTSIDISQIRMTLVPLTDTDVVIGENVLFDVTLRNDGEAGLRVDLWFTVDLNGLATEKEVTTPYLSRHAPLSGYLAYQTEATLRLQARPLENRQRGPYAFYAKAGRYDMDWVRASGNFQGIITAPTGPEGNEQRTGDSGEWVITAIWGVDDGGRSFLAGASEIAVPRSVDLSQNHPNPFNPSTTIAYEVRSDEAQDRPVHLGVYDLQGHLVRSLVEGGRPAGFYSVTWDGRDDVGNPVASGIYLFKIRSIRDEVIRKGILSR